MDQASRIILPVQGMEGYCTSARSTIRGSDLIPVPIFPCAAG